MRTGAYASWTVCYGDGETYFDDNCPVHMGAPRCRAETDRHELGEDAADALELDGELARIFVAMSAAGRARAGIR